MLCLSSNVVLYKYYITCLCGQDEGNDGEEDVNVQELQEVTARYWIGSRSIWQNYMRPEWKETLGRESEIAASLSFFTFIPVGWQYPKRKLSATITASPPNPCRWLVDGLKLSWTCIGRQSPGFLVFFSMGNVQKLVNKWKTTTLLRTL